MRFIKLVPFVLLAACSSGPSKQESVQVFTSATSAMSSAQSRAVSERGGGAANLDFSGPCTLGGTVAVSGSYAAEGSGSNAAFDLSTTFAGCRDATGTLDGNMTWTSVSDGTKFSATMTGMLDFNGSGGSASCDFDLHLSVDAESVSYSGSMCGYDVQADLGIRTN